MFTYEKIKNWPFEDIIHTYQSRDTILYALGIGLGEDNLDQSELNFLYENSDNFSVLPTMASVIGHSSDWLKNPATGINYPLVLHGEQNIIWHDTIPTKGSIKVETKVIGVSDKGPIKGALIYTQKTLTEATSGLLLATTRSTTIARGNGGYNGPSDPPFQVNEVPKGPPDKKCDITINPRAAIIYRLSGDYNPLHISPSAAKVSGFNKPIIHGLCSFGVAGHVILKTCCSYETNRMKELGLRFSAPIFPGETIRTEIWENGEILYFRSISLDRNKIVLDNGYARIQG